jgi:hypothetical protein
MIRRALTFLFRFWHIRIASVLPPMCRFHPSCSQYAIQALDRHRLLKALGLIGWRIARCNPFHPGGFDPAPGTHDCADHAESGGETEADRRTDPGRRAKSSPATKA